MTPHLDMFLKTSSEYFSWDAKAKTEVLLIEDCEMSNDIITELVNDFFWEEVKLTIAKTIKEAMGTLNSWITFDVVFLDWNLPDWKTLWLIKEITDKAMHIVSTSWCDNMQLERLKEWANAAIEKHRVPHYLKEILERI